MKKIALAIAASFLLACSTEKSQKPTEKKAINQASGIQDFDKTLKLQGVTFHIQCTNSSSLNKVSITPKGLEIDNSLIIVDADGTVTGAEVADLNADGSPEIYIYVTSSGSGSYGSLIAYSSNNKKSLSSIYLSDLADNKKITSGYMGHDEFAVVESILARRFPIYKASDSNSTPTGKTRQIQYKLKAGEAGWALKIDKIVEF